MGRVMDSARKRGSSGHVEKLSRAGGSGWDGSWPWSLSPGIRVGKGGGDQRGGEPVELLIEVLSAGGKGYYVPGPTMVFR